jgi:hypothetical protein
MDDRYPSNSEIIYIRSIEDSIKRVSEGATPNDQADAIDRHKHDMSKIRVRAYEKYFSSNRILYFQENNIINSVYDDIDVSKIKLDSLGGNPRSED